MSWGDTFASRAFFLTIALSCIALVVFTGVRILSGCGHLRHTQGNFGQVGLKRGGLSAHHIAKGSLGVTELSLHCHRGLLPSFRQGKLLRHQCPSSHCADTVSLLLIYLCYVYNFSVALLRTGRFRERGCRDQTDAKL